jgi:hypothetical protein
VSVTGKLLIDFNRGLTMSKLIFGNAVKPKKLLIFCGGIALLMGGITSVILARKAIPTPVTSSVNIQERASSLYLQLAMTPMSKRRVSYGALNGGEKTQVWLAHFALFEVNRTLNHEQQKFMADLRAIINGKDMNQDRKMIREQAANLHLYERSIALFGKHEAAALMNRLGGELTIRVRTSESPQAMKALATFDEDCSCSHYSDYCSGPIGNGGSCNDGAACQSVEDGCGVLWIYPCDGSCTGWIQTLEFMPPSSLQDKK